MKSKANILAGIILLLMLSIHSGAQDLRAFNQNSSRTNNHYSALSPGLNLSFSPSFSTSLNKSNDSLLFRGSGVGFRMTGDYFFGKPGIGFSSGFSSSAADNSSINNFLQHINLSPDQATITKSNQQNIYLLLGPSVRFGSGVQMLLHAQAGLFVNNGGLVMIQQKGAVRASYINESTSKSIYPGFQTGINIQYATKSDVWAFGFGADWMGTKTNISNFDIRRNGGAEALNLSKNISDLVAGITIRYNIGAEKGNLSSQRVLPTVNKKNIAIDEPGVQRLLPTVNKKNIAIDEPGVQRVLPTVNKKEIAIDEPGVQRMMDQSSCGPVTLKTTNTDGSVEEMTFACPNDAAQYGQRLSMTPTTTRQTQGSSFGEKVQQGLHKEGIIHRDLAARNILIGKVSHIKGNMPGIETNKTIASTEKTNNTKPGGISATIYAREAGSGMATGRRQYQPVFAADATNSCNDCIAEVVSNPLYQSSGNAGSNPLYQGKDNRLSNTNEDCDGVADLNVFLIDKISGATIATTKTEACGDFFFANLPSGAYGIKITGTIISDNGYDVTLNKKADIAGELISANDNWTIELNSGTGTPEQGAALIKTKTKSNQSNDRTIAQQENSGIIWSPRSNIKMLPVATGDVDGDGIVETIVGNNNSGGYGLVKGAPLKGVGVSLGKSPGGGSTSKTVQTNENGEFEFTNLSAGNYKIMVEQTSVINDETVVWVGDNETTDSTSNNNATLRAQNNNTVRSNRTDNAIVMNNGDTNNSKEIGPKKWMAPEAMRSALNTSEDNLKNMTMSLDELDQQTGSDKSNNATTINDAHNNIKNLRNAIADAQQTIDNFEQKDKDAALRELDQKMVAINTQFSLLQTTLSKMGKQYSSISNVLKTRHETAKNSISNIR